MRTKSKVLIGMIAVLVVALPLISGALAAPAYNGWSNQATNVQSKERLEWSMTDPWHGHRKEVVSIWFFREAKAVTINGTVITHFRNILIVNADGKRLNILLPPQWSIDSNVTNATAMFNENHVKVGDTVTIKALQREATNKQDVTITIILAYEITDTTSGNHLYAVLPFNISND